MKDYRNRRIVEQNETEDIYNLLSTCQENIYEINRTMTKLNRLISELQDCQNKLENIVYDEAY